MDENDLADIHNIDPDGDDDGRSEADSALGDNISLYSSTASLRSSLARHREENGRKYHGFKDGKYVLPTDEEELQRQEYQYQLCLATFGAHAFATFRNLHRVLDVGCGRGDWAIDFAEAHPEAEARLTVLLFHLCSQYTNTNKIVGIDLAPVQEYYVPPNVQFQIDDLEEPWTFSFKYDYIHVSMMTGAFRDWSNFYYQAFHFLKSEGWVEIQDIDFPLQCADGSLPSDSAMRRWSDLMLEASRKSGYLLDTCGKAAELMREAGFVDIVRVPYKWPIGPWPRDPSLKQLGAWVFENFHGGIETMSLALFTRFLGWSLDEVRAFAEEARAELCNRNFHTHFDMYVTYGRKP